MINLIQRIFIKILIENTKLARKWRENDQMYYDSHLTITMVMFTVNRETSDYSI